MSFLRPLAKGLLRKPDGPGSRVTVLDPPDPGMRAHVGYLRAHQFTQWGGSAGWPNYELPFVRWAERNGYQLDYAVNADLEDPATLADRRVYLSVGHDEYWSGPMRDTVESFTRAGGNALFLSGNTAFWQVRITDDGTAMIGFKDRFERDPVFGTAEQHRLTSMWSDHLVGRPENAMTGVSFVRGGYHRIGRTVSPRVRAGTPCTSPTTGRSPTPTTTYGDSIGAAAWSSGTSATAATSCSATAGRTRPAPTARRPTSRSSASRPRSTSTATTRPGRPGPRTAASSSSSRGARSGPRTPPRPRRSPAATR